MEQSGQHDCFKTHVQHCQSLIAATLIFLAVPHEYHTPNAKKQSMDAEIAITLPKNVTNRGVTQLLRCNAD